ncbi:tyrosine-type recombinase/integrase [Fredinandcohnia humi]
MPIEIRSSINYEEVCRELGISLESLYSLVNQSEELFIKEENEYSIIEVIDDFINHIKSKRGLYSANTAKYYISFLTRFKVFLESYSSTKYIEEINEDLLMAFLQGQNITSIGTINTYKAITRKLITFAYENDILTKNIRYRFTKHKYHLLPKYFSDEQIKSILKLTLNRTHGYRWRAVFITLLGTGLRVSELVNLRVRDINIKEQLIYTIGKGNKERYIVLYPEVKNALINYLNLIGLEINQRNRDCYIFCKDYDKDKKIHISVRSVQYTLKNILKKLNYDSRLTVHSFRHTFAVNCLRSGMKLEYLSQVLGHDDPKTTTIYTKLFPVDLREEITGKYPIPFEKIIKEIM